MRHLNSFGDTARMLLALCCAGCGFFWTAPVVALSAQDVFLGAGDTVWVLETQDEKNRAISAASAIVIDAEKAIAQCDVIQGVAHIQLSRNGQNLKADLLGSSEGGGLCLLRVAGLPASATLKSVGAEVGAKVFAVSNALGLGLGISDGVISGIRSVNGKPIIQFTAPIAPGSEGGGLFDSEGRLLGFITYHVRDGQNINFAIPVQQLLDIESRVAPARTDVGWRKDMASLAQEEKWLDLIELATRALSEDNKDVEAWVLLAFAAQQVGKWPEAERAHREVLKLAPSYVSSGIGLSKALLHQNQAQAAADVARDILAQRQEDPLVWVALGQAEMSLAHIAQAKQAFERAVQIDSWNIEAHAGLAAIARANSDWPAVVAAYRAMSRIAPQEVKIWLLLSEAYRLDQRPQRALSSAEQALTLAPNNDDAKLFKGAALIRLNRFKEGISILRRVTSGSALRPSLAWELLGEAYYAQKMFTESIQAYKEAVRLEPESLSAKQGLGLALKDGFYFSEALAVFEVMKQAHPEDPFPWRQIGYVHSYQAQPEKAIPAYKQSLQINSKQPKVWRALIEAYHFLGDKEAMRRAHEQLRVIDAVAAEQAYKYVLLPYEGVAP